MRFSISFFQHILGARLELVGEILDGHSLGERDRTRDLWRRCRRHRRRDPRLLAPAGAASWAERWPSSARKAARPRRQRGTHWLCRQRSRLSEGYARWRHRYAGDAARGDRPCGRPRRRRWRRSLHRDGWLSRGRRRARCGVVLHAQPQRRRDDAAGPWGRGRWSGLRNGRFLDFDLDRRLRRCSRRRLDLGRCSFHSVPLVCVGRWRRALHLDEPRWGQRPWRRLGWLCRLGARLAGRLSALALGRPVTEQRPARQGETAFARHALDELAGDDFLNGARRALHLDAVIALQQRHHVLARRVEYFGDFVDPNGGQTVLVSIWSKRPSG